MPDAADHSKPATATAAVFVAANRPLSVRQFPVLRPSGESVLIRMERSGICGTDLHIATGRLPLGPMAIIPGHELVGTIEALGKPGLADGLGRRLRPGDRVIACVAKPCGKCFNCRDGQTASCLSFGVTYFQDPNQPPHLLGGFAQYLHSPAANVVTVPASISLDAVAAFPCAGPTVIRAMDFAGPLRRGELVVVQGAGPVGLFATAWAASHGCVVAVIASSSNPARARLARQLGASVVLDRLKVSQDERLKRVKALAAKLKRGDGADVVIEASGAPSAVPEGLNLVRTLGRYVMPGQYSSSGPVSIQPQLITFKAIRIIGSGQYKLADIATYLAFLRRRPALQAKLARCITHRYEVARINEAIRDVEAGKVVKGVLVQ